MPHGLPYSSVYFQWNQFQGIKNYTGNLDWHLKRREVHGKALSGILLKHLFIFKSKKSKKIKSSRYWHDVGV